MENEELLSQQAQIRDQFLLLLKCKKGKEVRKVGKNKYIVVTKEKRDKDWWLEEEINSVLQEKVTPKKELQ